MSTGRNDPCPCGSGKKYKQCCMGKEPQQGQRSVVPALIRQAVSYLETGRLAQADAACQQALGLVPNHPGALHVWGLLARHQGQPSLAVERISRAIKAEAQPSAFMHFNRAAALHELGRLDEAIADYRRVVSLKPGHAEVHSNLGQAYLSLGRLDEAAASCQRALQHQPDLLVARHTLGLILLQQGKLEAAGVSFQHELQLTPEAVDTWTNLGAVFRRMGQLDDAESCYRQALLRRPDYVDALANLALVLQDKGRSEESVTLYHKALQYRPDGAMIYNNLVVALLALGRYEEAEQACRQALFLDPRLLMAHNNLGNVLREQGRMAEAEAAYRQALTLNPGMQHAHANLLCILQYRGGVGPEALFLEHRRFAARFETPLKLHWQPHANTRDPARRLKVGYVSGDFCYHAVACYIEPVLAHHDRAKIDVYCYYNRALGDAVSERFRALADHWLPCTALSDDALAERIRRDGIDILVDLSGHTALNRLLTFARKPAPVQVTWLGYLGSTGLDAVDYRLTDAVLDPEGQAEAYYAETVVRLPNWFTFRPEPDSPPVNELPALRSDTFTLACLNNLVKISPEVVRLWARILHELPNARLMLGNVTEAAVASRLQARFAALGIDAERLLLMPRLPIHDYLRLHHQIDLALDPFPFGGGVTTSHSLWMGVPVVTLAGSTTVSRQGASILSAAGLPEFIASSEDDYVRCAREMAQDLPRLNAIRQGLRAHSCADAAGLTRHLEAAYASMWQTWCQS